MKATRSSMYFSLAFWTCQSLKCVGVKVHMISFCFLEHIFFTWDILFTMTTSSLLKTCLLMQQSLTLLMIMLVLKLVVMMLYDFNLPCCNQKHVFKSTRWNYFNLYLPLVIGGVYLFSSLNSVGSRICYVFVSFLKISWPRVRVAMGTTLLIINA